ncbi:hypothetical protein [Geodermatophilus sp. URMC 63]
MARGDGERAASEAVYDAALTRWRVPVRSRDVVTRWGRGPHGAAGAGQVVTGFLR